MKTIPLTQGYEAIVDDEDYDILVQFKWCLEVTINSFYAIRNTSIDTPTGRSQRSIRMHQQLLGTQGQPRPDVMVDHIDHNGLNNQRSNLRVTTQAENNRNRVGANSNSRTGVRGVHLDKESGKYKVSVGYNYDRYYFGRYDTLEEAANVAERERAKLYSATLREAHSNDTARHV